MSDTQQTCQPQIVAQAFHDHVQKCDKCRANIIAVTEDLDKPLDLCDEGKKLLAAIFN